VLRGHLSDLGLLVELQTELIAIEQDADKVTATLINHSNGRKEVVPALYVVGADGGRGTLR
jgi:putative polyketide hydroxylase